MLVDVDCPLKSEEGVETTPFDCRASMNNALRYVTYLRSDRFYSLILNQKLYQEDEEWSALF